MVLFGLYVQLSLLTWCSLESCWKVLRERQLLYPLGLQTVSCSSSREVGSYSHRYKNKVNRAHKKAWRRHLTASMWKYSSTESFIHAIWKTSAGESDTLYQVWPLKMCEIKKKVCYFKLPSIGNSVPYVVIKIKCRSTSQLVNISIYFKWNLHENS